MKTLLEKPEIPELNLPIFQKIVMLIYWNIYKLFFLSKGAKSDYKKTIDDLKGNPWKVQAYLLSEIRYRKDTKPEHHWQPPEKTWKDKAGDCEDWAIFALECLKSTHNCNILCMYKKDSGHATLLIKDGNKSWRSIGTFGFMKHKGVISDIIPNWRGYEKWTYYKLYDEEIDYMHRKDRE